jgi:hypothetical protein
MENPRGTRDAMTSAMDSSPKATFARRVCYRVVLAASLGAGAVVGVVATEGTASAQVAEEVVEVAPPAPQVEVIPAAPSAYHVWSPGYWGYYRGYGHRWNRGGWIPGRAGYSWRGPHWEGGGHRWVMHPGRWHRR